MTEEKTVPTLERMTESDLKELPRAALVALCMQAGQPGGGTKAVLLKRLVAIKRGGATKHVHGKTLCPMKCGGYMAITGTHHGQRYGKCRKCGYKRSWPIA